MRKWIAPALVLAAMAAIGFGVSEREGERDRMRVDPWCASIYCQDGEFTCAAMAREIQRTDADFPSCQRSGSMWCVGTGGKTICLRTEERCNFVRQGRGLVDVQCVEIKSDLDGP